MFVCFCFCGQGTIALTSVVLNILYLGLCSVKPWDTVFLYFFVDIPLRKIGRFLLNSIPLKKKKKVFACQSICLLSLMTFLMWKNSKILSPIKVSFALKFIVVLIPWFKFTITCATNCWQLYGVFMYLIVLL